MQKSDGKMTKLAVDASMDLHTTDVYASGALRHFES